MNDLNALRKQLLDDAARLIRNDLHAVDTENRGKGYWRSDYMTLLAWMRRYWSLENLEAVEIANRLNQKDSAA